MKSYTDLEQSKKLAEILPIESADMKILSFGIDIKRRVVPVDDIAVLNREDEIPCWSLAALLNYLREIDSFPEIYADEFAVTMNISYFYRDVENECRLEHMDSINVKEETFIDACYEMILKLKEKDLI